MRLLHGRGGGGLSESAFGTELAALFARDLARLSRQLRAFTDTAALWAVVPGITNPAGTLALHLEGNLREYVGRQLGGLAYERDRPREFSARGLEQAELVRRIDAVAEMVPRVVGALSAAAMDGTIPEPFDGQSLTARAFLVHLYAHLSYHLGQVDYVRRAVTGDGALPPAD